MVDIGRFLIACVELYFGVESREDGFDFIHTHVLWSEPFFIMLFFSLWYALIGDVEFTFFSIVESAIHFSLVSVILFGIIYFFMRVLGGIGTFKDTYKFGLSIWFFPVIVNIILSFVNGLIGVNFISILLGVFASLVAIWFLIISVLVYSKIHKLSIEMSVLGLLFPFILTSVFILLLKFFL